MKKWDLLLCEDALFELALEIDRLNDDKFAFTPIREILINHNLVISDELLGCYERCFETFTTDKYTVETCMAIGQGYIIEMYDKKNNSPYKWIEEESRDAKEHIDDAMATIYKELEGKGESPLIVCQNGHFAAKNKFRTVDFETWLEKNISNLLTRNTLNFDCTAYKNVEAKVFQEWFGELFSDESEFEIFDSYFWKKQTIQSFVNYYLPCMMPNSTVNVYCTQGDIPERDGETIKRLLSSKAKEYSIRIKMFDAIDVPEHDRFLYTEHFKLTIGLGFDYISKSSGRVRKNTKIFLTRYPDTELNRFKREYESTPFYKVGD